MPEHTTNLTKTLAGRWLERILTKKLWNLSRSYTTLCVYVMKLKVLPAAISYAKLQS